MTDLLHNPNFISNIRKYNAAFSFVSFNATSDKNLSTGNIYTLRIQGQIHHRIGPLLPQLTKEPVNAQVYFKDEDQSNARLKYSPGLNPCVLIQIQAMLLDECKNPFIEQFKKASTLYKSMF